jgi:alanyl-tRNA synthetase
MAAVEDIANRIILQNEPVVTRLMGLDEARDSGARALFGEKYGDEVRVVSMGTQRTSDHEAAPYSVELCGGTHAGRTGDIGIVTIVGESAVSSGVRRIEAKTARAAREHLNSESSRLQAVANLLKAPTEIVPDRLSALIEDRRRLERELADARKKLAMAGGSSDQGSGGSTRTVAGVTFFARAVTGIEMKDLKGLADEAKKTIGSGVIALVGVGEDGKAGIVVAVTKDLTDRFNAVELVRVGSDKLGGKGGGGRPDMAQAGGPNGAEAEAALEAVASALGQRLAAE